MTLFILDSMSRSHTSIYCPIIIYTNPAQMPAQKNTPQMFQSFQSTTQKGAAHLYYDIRECYGINFYAQIAS